MLLLKQLLKRDKNVNFLRDGLHTLPSLARSQRPPAVALLGSSDHRLGTLFCDARRVHTMRTCARAALVCVFVFVRIQAVQQQQQHRQYAPATASASLRRIPTHGLSLRLTQKRPERIRRENYSDTLQIYIRAEEERLRPPRITTLLSFRRTIGILTDQSVVDESPFWCWLLVTRRIAHLLYS